MVSYNKSIVRAASLAASLILVWSLTNELLLSEATWRHTISVEEKEWWSSNNVYGAVKAYLAARIDNAPANFGMQRPRTGNVESEVERMVVSMDVGQEIADIYEGTVTRHVKGDPNGGGRAREVRSYELSFHKRHKEKALKEYLPFIVSTAKAIKDEERSLSIYMNDYSVEWAPVELQYPSTFGTLAMDGKQKQSIIDDLNRFIKRKDYYKMIGKAWKRGYLLYGPPGTSKYKLSLIAPIANHLRFDTYNLELAGVNSNSDLRKLLVGMTNKSILLVEDIDCTIDLKKQEENYKDEEHGKSNSTYKMEAEDKVKLSALLNFVDALWSTSEEERIITLTANYKERLDPSLLRHAMMDMHIHMGNCTSDAFRVPSACLMV